MKSRIATLAGAGALAWTLLSPTQAGAQATPVICDGLTATIVGTAGDDRLEGTEGADVIFAAQGNDIIFGLGGDDVICAGKGDDIVMGGAGFDIIFGAQGDDVLFAANGSTVADRQDVRGARMFGGAGNDLMVGSNRWDRMQGGLGVDHFEGYEGRDWVRGGADTDYINGGAGIDDTNGGNGNDRMIVTAGDTVRGSNGNDLCNLLGEPELLRSCTSDAQAFSTARHMPIAPPTLSGLQQALDYESAVFNSRNIIKFPDLFYEACTRDQNLAVNLYAALDDVFGAGWTTEQFANSAAIDDLSADLKFSYNYRDANGTIVESRDQANPYVYEQGTWRVGFCLN